MTIYSPTHKKPEQKIIERFKEIWPELTQMDFWDRLKCNGYMTVPKTMPLICVYMDCLEKGGPLSPTYLSLWAHTFDLPCLEIKNERLMAMESGFRGQRPVDTWKKRMEALVKWGFIRAESRLNDFQFVILPNPHLVIMKIHNDPSNLYDKEHRNEIYVQLVDLDKELNGNGFLTLVEHKNNETKKQSRSSRRKP